MSSRTLISYAQLGAAGTEIKVFVPALTLLTHKLQTGPADLSPGLKLFSLPYAMPSMSSGQYLAVKFFPSRICPESPSCLPDTLPDLG